MALLENRPRSATVRARTATEMFGVARDPFLELVQNSASAARALFGTVLKRFRNQEAMLRQSEKMAQLGTLTAGVAHELNNPAAAVRRGTEQLQTEVNEYAESYVAMSHMELSESQFVLWKQLKEQAQERGAMPPELDALARSDMEYALEEWLEEAGIADGWQLAPTLVNLNLSAAQRQELAAEFDAVQLAALLRTVNAVYNTCNLFAELKQGAERISSIVGALKTYSFLDQAPVQVVDINKGLDDSLLILRHKLKNNISVRRQYDSNLPRIEGYGSELNQVWTNLIDNAADALADKPPGEGVITIRTRQESHPEGDFVVVEVEDNGPGIPREIQERVYEPFFTTKPPGKGTGLGLEISYNIVVLRHEGDIRLESEPGRTLFQVLLPVDDSCVIPGRERET
jgi:signal transduction histidine kinase